MTTRKISSDSFLNIYNTENYWGFEATKATMFDFFTLLTDPGQAGFVGFLDIFCNFFAYSWFFIDSYFGSVDFVMLRRDFGWVLPADAFSHFLFVPYLLAVGVLLGLILVVVFFVSPFSYSSEKLSSYECGFDPFGDARTVFDIHFYVVGILFLIFDLEVVFLVPWLYAPVEGLSLLLDWPVMSVTGVFLVLLGLGFIYEWVKNALVWVPVRLQ